MSSYIRITRSLMLLLVLLLLTAACTASRPPTPTPPPASAGGAAEATQPPTPSPTPSPTETQKPTPTQALDLTATAQAEREQAEKQLWQEIEQLQQFFKEGYSYTLEEPYSLRVASGDSVPMVVADLVFQELDLVQIEDKSLLDYLEHLGRLAEQAGYRMEINMDGEIKFHGDGGIQYPIYLKNWQIVYRRGHFNPRSWDLKGPGLVAMDREGYWGAATYCFLVDPSGRAKGKILKTDGEGKHKLELFITLKSTDAVHSDNESTLQFQRISVGSIYLSYKAYNEVDYSKGRIERLELLPGTEIQIVAP